LRVKVAPRAKSPGLKVEADGRVVVYVRQPPEKGKANRACRDLLSAGLGLPRGALTLVSGAGSREKVWRVEGLSEAEGMRRLRSRNNRESLESSECGAGCHEARFRSVASGGAGDVE